MFIYVYRLEISRFYRKIAKNTVIRQLPYKSKEKAIFAKIGPKTGPKCPFLCGAALIKAPKMVIFGHFSKNRVRVKFAHKTEFSVNSSSSH